MRVLGVDPGLQCVGYGVISAQQRERGMLRRPVAGMKVLEAGVIRSDARERLERRIHQIYRGIEQVLAAFNPEVLILEELYSHYAHPRTAIVMGHARGAICLAAAQAGIDVIGYPARKVKQAVTGSGSADKMQMQRMVRELLKLPKLPAPHDVADALALAITHAHEAGAEL